MTFGFRLAPTPLTDEVGRAEPIYAPADPIPVKAWDAERGVFIVGELLDD